MFRTSSALACVCLAATLSSTGPTAQARDVHPTAGIVTLHLSAVAHARLDAADVTVSGRRLKVSRGLFSFASLGRTGGGTLRLDGRLRFRRGARAVTLERLSIALAAGAGNDRSESGRLTAVVGGHRFPVGVLLTHNYRSRDGRFDGLAVELSPATVGNLNRALGARAFRSGELLGAFAARTVTQRLTFAGGYVRMELPAAALDAATKAHATFRPLPPATGSATKVAPFAFPISAGSLELVSRTGVLRLNGGFRLTVRDEGRPDTRTEFTSLTLRATGAGYVLRTPGNPVFAAANPSSGPGDVSAKRFTRVGLSLRLAPVRAQAFAPMLRTSAEALLSPPDGELSIVGDLA